MASDNGADRGTFQEARLRWRRWRRTRPFWGGLLLILAGVELLMIPLSSILIHGAIKLVIYIGIGGVFGVLIGILLIACGILLWLMPVHRTFYAIAGVVLAMLSFITSNLGGFFLGMLLGITGGSLAFAWTPGTGSPDPVPVQETDPLPDATSPDVLGEGTWLAAPEEPDEAQQTGQHRGGGKLLAAAMPAVLLGTLLTGHAAVQRPSATATPSPGAKNITAQVGDPGLEAATAMSVITASSATLNGLAYQGTAKVPVAGGGTETLMKFNLTSMTLSGNVTATVTQNGLTTQTQASSLAFSGGVTLYASKLSGSLLGISLTLTPDSVVSLLLQVLNTLTPAVPLTMSNVTTDQFLVMAGSLQAANLTVTS